MELPAEDFTSFEVCLGQLLIEQGKIDTTALDRAKRLSEGQNEPLHTLLPKLGLVSERDVANALADQLGLPLVAAEDLPALPLLEDPAARQRVSDGYRRLRELLGEPGVTRRAASAILDALPENPTS